MTATGWWPLASGAPEPGRHAQRRRPPGRRRTVALTSCADQLEHQVDVEVLDHAAGEPGGPVVTRCGALVLPAPLSTPPGRLCPRCSAEVRGDAAGDASTSRITGAQAIPAPRRREAGTPPATRSWLTFGLGGQRPPRGD